MRIPNVGAVYDRPQFGEMQASQLWAVIDRPYIGDSHSFRTFIRCYNSRHFPPERPFRQENWSHDRIW